MNTEKKKNECVLGNKAVVDIKIDIYEKGNF